MKVLLIGMLGHSGSIYGAKTPYELVGIARGCTEENPAPLQKNAADRGIPYFDDPVAAMDALRPDAAVINTVYAYNGKLAIEALNRGIHVYCEKPVATEPALLAQVEEAASKSDALLFAMLTARFESHFYTAKKLIDAGTIGKIRIMTGQKSYKLGTRPDFYADRALYGGTIPWVAIHSLDQLLWLSGEGFESVSAYHSSLDNGDNGTMERTCVMNMRLTGDILAASTADFLRPEKAPTHGDDRIRVAGLNGVIEVRGGEVYLTDAEHDGLTPLPKEEPEQIFDCFLRLCADPEARKDPLYRDISAIEATRLGLALRDSADANR
ncbi:MAG: Gfo/Idh/MocA family oxidoreductase [Clostridia bacterium]|nr:Gfo/Idh/MocA family oxidoreductase [Clostridia bacterium]